MVVNGEQDSDENGKENAQDGGAKENGLREDTGN